MVFDNKAFEADNSKMHEEKLNTNQSSKDLQTKNGEDTTNDVYVTEEEIFFPKDFNWFFFYFVRRTLVLHQLYHNETHGVMNLNF